MSLLSNLQFALRLFYRNLSSSVIAVVVLALGLAMTITMYTMSKTMLWDQPQFNKDKTIYEVRWVPPQATQEFLFRGMKVEDFDYFGENLQSFDAFVGYHQLSFSLYNPELQGDSLKYQSARISHNFFDVLGIKPVLGRLPTTIDASGSEGETAMISYQLWQEQFNSDTGIIGKSILLNSQPHTVIGVMPEGIRFPAIQHIWKPYDWRYERANGRGAGFLLEVLATVKPGVDKDTAHAELNSLASQLQQAYPKFNKHYSRTVFEQYHPFNDGFKSILMMLLFGSFMVLQTACANISNLLLARVNARQFELGMRKVLGAKKREICAQVLTDAMVMSAVGLIFAVLIAGWALRFIDNLLYTNYAEFTPYWWSMAIDWKVLLFSAGVMLFAIVAASLSPLLKILKQYNNDVIKDNSRTSSGLSASRTGRVLITSQIMFTTILLTVAGVYTLWVHDIRDNGLAFDPKSAIFNNLYVTTSAVSEADGVDRFFENIERDLKEIPGVRDVSFSYSVMNFGFPRRELHVEGQAFDPEEISEFTASNIVNNGFFDLFKGKINEGRLFNELDTKDSMPVAIVDETFAKHYFPNESAIGKRIRVNMPGNDWEPQNDINNPWTDWLTIVGVTTPVENMKGYDKAEKSNRLWQYHNVYLPLSQRTSRVMYMLVSGEGDATQYTPAISRVISEEEPTLAPNMRYETLQAFMDRNNAFIDLVTNFIVIFGFVALGMAAVGLYGIASFSTQQKTRDFAIRRSLGATKQRIIQLVLNTARWQLIIGLAIGLPAAYVLQQMISVSQNFADQTNVPDIALVTIYVAVTATIASVMLLSVLIPALRAANLPPNAALRSE